MVALGDDGIQACWTLYDRVGLRPEYLLPVLYFESGFNPAIPNAAGSPYYGIGQNSAAQIAASGSTPTAYLAMSAGDQIRSVVTSYFAGVVARYGALRSATRSYQANFLPATLATVRGLAQIVTPKGTAYYASNVVLDPLHHGAITLSDLAFVMTRSAAAAEVRTATARAYVLRPSEVHNEQEPVYGTDFLDPGLSALLSALLVTSWRARL